MAEQNRRQDPPRPFTNTSSKPQPPMVKPPQASTTVPSKEPATNAKKDVSDAVAKNAQQAMPQPAKADQDGQPGTGPTAGAAEQARGVSREGGDGASASHRTSDPPPVSTASAVAPERVYRCMRQHAFVDGDAVYLGKIGPFCPSCIADSSLFREAFGKPVT